MLARVVEECEDRMIVMVTHRGTALAVANRVLLCRDGGLHDATDRVVKAGGRLEDVLVEEMN